MRSKSRWTLGAAAALFCTLPLCAQTLRQLAEARGMRVGAAVDPTLLSDPDYAGTLAREFNQVEPENVMKFGPIHPEPDRYNFAPADALAAFARQHQMAVRGHTLVWHRQAPAWVSKKKDFVEIARILDQHIRAVVGHFAGQVYAWDVVNEAFNEDGSLRETPWSGMGDVYLSKAFRAAHAADRRALLFYNDYDAEAISPKSNAVFEMVRKLRAEGVPLDGVGLQMHLSTEPPPLDRIEANLKRLIGLGIEVQITELDVRVPVGESGAASTEMLQKQAAIYGAITALCAKFPKCTAIQTWGFTDAHSWVPGFFKGTGAALPFDSGYRPKPAYEAMRKSLRKR